MFGIHFVKTNINNLLKTYKLFGIISEFILKYKLSSRHTLKEIIICIKSK